MLLIQQIGNQTQIGGPERFQLQRIVEAAQNPESNLTYSALTGQRKQSVGDVEKLFNPGLVAVLKQKGYDYEAQYIEKIMNWRRACDERGISQSCSSFSVQPRALTIYLG